MNKEHSGYQGAIFDVDGVLVASPHERAWCDTLRRLFDTEWSDILSQTSYTPERYTTAVYQEHVSGKPRMSGAIAALRYFGVPDAAERAKRYAECKQEQLIELINAGEFTAFPDGSRFMLAMIEMGLHLAAASSSKNADLFLKQLRPDTSSQSYRTVSAETTLLEMFEANVCGRDLKEGKPHPEIFQTAAKELNLSTDVCFVVEDATSGIQAAKAGGMVALGVARLDDAAQLLEAGADLVVTSLDDVALDALAKGRLEKRGTS
jgi:HAD superfamily hydrolase (TIGR01509 family)